MMKLESRSITLLVVYMIGFVITPFISGRFEPLNNKPDKYSDNNSDKQSRELLDKMRGRVTIEYSCYIRRWYRSTHE